MGYKIELKKNGEIHIETNGYPTSVDEVFDSEQNVRSFLEGVGGKYKNNDRHACLGSDINDFRWSRMNKR